MHFSNDRNAVWGLLPWYVQTWMATGESGGEGNTEKHLPLLVADKGCSMFPMRTKGADCPSLALASLLGRGTAGLGSCCLLLPLSLKLGEDCS